MIVGIIALGRWIYFEAPTMGSVQISSALEALAPLSLYRIDHGEPSFMKRGGRA